MKKLIFVLLAVVCVGGIALYVSQKQGDSTAQGQGAYRVAFFAPAVHPSMDDIERGVRQNLKNVSVDTYNANGNRTLLRAQAEEIVQRSYDLIITVGAQCSQVVHQLEVKKGLTTPQVFCAVDDPMKLGLISGVSAPENQTTGVLSTSDYARQIHMLTELKPHIKGILLVYDPAHGSGLEKDRIALEQEAQKRGIGFETLEVANAQDIAQKVPAQLSSADVVLVLTDHTVCAAIDILVTLCNRYHVLLYTSELNSVDKGAGLAFGVTEYDYGNVAAQLAHRILFEHQRPAQIPVTTMEFQYIKINTKTAPLQGLDLSADRLDALRVQGAIII